MKSTRDKIIGALLRNPNATINHLSETVGINGISVRHHLTNLQAQGLVVAEEERHGVGRPRLVYRLTDKGIEKFPTNYLQLTNRLLDEMKANYSNEEVSKLFSQVATKLVDPHKEVIKDLDIEAKLDYLKEVLAKEGFIVEWEKSDGKYLIKNISCPFYHIGSLHSEVCIIDKIIISTLLDKSIEMEECVLDGYPHCSYSFKEK